MIEALLAALGGAGAASAGYALGAWRSRREQERSNVAATSEIERLTARLKAVESAPDRLTRDPSRREPRSQGPRPIAVPVVLCGPRGTGKSSALRALARPWDGTPIAATPAFSAGPRPATEIPVALLAPEARAALDPSASAALFTLRIHDLPGELDTLRSLCDLLAQETQSFRAALREARVSGAERAGVTLLLFFDAYELRVKSVSRETVRYFTSDTFRTLRQRLRGDLSIERAVVVLNRYDLVRAARPNEDPHVLLDNLHELAMSEFALEEISTAPTTESLLTIFELDSPDRARSAEMLRFELSRHWIERFERNPPFVRSLPRPSSPKPRVGPASLGSIASSPLPPLRMRAPARRSP